VTRLRPRPQAYGNPVTRGKGLADGPEGTLIFRPGQTPAPLAPEASVRSTLSLF
jgi:hypothetical protein